MATADNLKIAQQLLAIQQQVTAQVQRQTEIYTAQVTLVEALCKAQECFSNIDPNKVKEIADAMAKAQEQTKEFRSATQQASEKVGLLDGAVKELADHVKKLSVPKEFLKGLQAGFNFSNNLAKGLLQLGGPLLTLFKDLAMTFLSFPGKVMEFFQNAAVGGIDPYRQALEEVREEFGNLKIGMSKAVIGMTEAMKGMRTLGETGLRFARVFGYGREGLAKLLTENAEIAKGMGPLFEQFAASLGNSVVDFTVLRKATNLSAEAFKGLFLSAQESGMSSGQMVKELTKDIARAERAFGISAKLYGKDMDYMIKETASFGIMGRKEMLSVSTYARKLGVSLESLKAVMDKTLNFEDVAQSSAKLSEAFGIQIDNMQLLKAQTPTEKMEILRKSFFAAGKDIEKMDNAQRKLLADAIPLGDEQLRIAFAQKNRALSGAQLDAQMKKQQKTQISQAEAMKQLSESIKRLIQSGQPLKGSFIDIFMKGFFFGIRRTKEFRQVVYSLQRAMRIVYWAGYDVGRMFVKLFPGIKEMLAALKNLFNPRNFRELMGKVKKEFRDFFLLLRTDPKAGVENFMKNMKKIFFDFFTKSAPAGSRFLDGLKQFWKATLVILVEGMRKGLAAVRDLARMLIDAIKNPEAFARAAQQMGGGLTDSIAGTISYIVTELQPVFMEAAEALWGLFKLMFETLYKKFIEPNLGYIIAFYFGPAIIGALVRGSIVALLQGVAAVVTRSAQVSQTIGAGMTQVTKTTGPNGTVTETTISREAAKTEKLGTQLLKLAGTLVILIFAVALLVGAVIVLAKLYEKSGIKKESFLIVGIMVGAITALMLTMMKLGFFEAAQTVGTLNMANLGVGLGILALTIIGIGLVALGVIGLAKIAPDAEKVYAVTALMMVMTFLFFAAIPLVAAASALGASAFLSGGLAAGAAVTGMASLAATLVSIGTTAKTIVDKFKDIPESQIQGTALIMRVIVDLYRVVAHMLDSIVALSSNIKDGNKVEKIIGELTGLIHKIAESATKIITEINLAGDIQQMKSKADLISSVLQGLGSIVGPLANFARAYAENQAALNPEVFTKFGEASTKIVESLSKAVKDILAELKTFLSGISNVELIKAAGITIANIMQAVGGLIGLIMQMFPAQGRATGILTAGAAGAGIGAMIGSVIPGVGTGIGAAIGFVVGAAISWLSQRDEFNQRVDAVKEVFNAVVGKIKDLVKGITEPLKTLMESQTISEQGVKAASAIAPIISAVATIFSAILGVSDSFKSLKDLTPENVSQIIGKFTTLIEGVLPKLETFIGTIKSLAVDIINSIATGLSARVTSDDKLKAMENIIKIVDVITSMITSVMATAKTIIEKSTGTPQEIQNIISTGKTFLETVIGQMPTFITTISTNIQSLITSISSLRIPTGITEKIKVVKILFEAVKAVTGVYSDILQIARASSGTGESDEVNQRSVSISSTTSMQRLGESINAMVGVFSNETFIGNIQTLITKILNLSFGRSSIETVLQRVRVIKQVFEAVKSISEAMESIRNLAVTSTGQGATTPLPANILNRRLTSLNNILESLSSETIFDETRGISRPNPLRNRELYTKIAEINENLESSSAVYHVRNIKNKVVSLVTNLSTLADSMAQLTDIKNTINNVQTVTITDINNIETKLKSVFGGIMEGGRDVSLLSMLENVFNREDVSRVSRSLHSVTTSMNETILRDINAMVRAYNQFSLSLSRLETASGNGGAIQVSLDRLGTNLEGRRTQTIENAAVHAEINVEVRMNVGDIVQALQTQSIQRNQRNSSLTKPAFKIGSFVNAGVRET